MIELAVQEGFAGAVMVNTADLPFDASFRPLCEENLCGKYGVNYACPPDCGSPEAMAQRLLASPRALVLQTIWEIADYGDKKATAAAKKSHNEATLRLLKKLRSEGCDGLPVGSGGCSVCKTCAIVEGKPCAFPELQFSCMSAYCIFVRKLAEQCGLEYDCGPGLLGFFGMIVPKP